MRLSFTSSLPYQLRSQLEDLFFFNSEQKLFLPEIEESIEVLGIPKIQDKRDNLVIHLPNFPHAQCLFCLNEANDRLLAAMIYFRSETSELEVFHIALLKKILSEQQSIQLLFDCIKTMKKIAKQINGVEWLVLPYGRGKIKL
jgi:hypothetical protein